MKVELDYETRNGRIISKSLPVIVDGEDYNGDSVWIVDEDNLTPSQERFYNLYLGQVENFDPFSNCRERWGNE